MDASQERELARGLRDGNPDAWHALYDAYAEKIWRHVARLMGSNSADVADVVQESFLAAARSARTFDAERGSLWIWLCAIARNHVALHYRKQERQNRIRQASAALVSGNGRSLIWSEGSDSSSAATGEELALLVRAALTELPADYEHLLTAKYLDGASVETIAGLDQSSPTAVRSKLARARRAFREVFLKVSTSFTDKSGERTL